MEIYVYWFLLALILVGLEMATGTFYLLVVAFALAMGGSTSLLGFGMTTQYLIAALTGVVGTVILRRCKSARASDLSGQSLDTGQAVKVVIWRDDGTARVFYRGAEWDAELEDVNSKREGAQYIKAMRGSILVIGNKK